MKTGKQRILFVTDLYYKASQRTYYTEDIFLTSQLRKDFDLIICHPKDTAPFENVVDAIVFRNTGPVIYYQKEYEAFRVRLLNGKTLVYNSLTGKADMRGKQYLVDLSKDGYKYHWSLLNPAVQLCEDGHSRQLFVYCNVNKRLSIIFTNR